MVSPGRSDGSYRTGAPLAMKRALNYFFIVLFAGFSIIQPGRAYALFFVPALPILGPPIIASVSGATYSFAALAGLVGLTGLYLALKDAEGNEVRLPVSTKPEAIPPAPSAAPNATGTTQPKVEYLTGGFYPRPTPAESCAAYAASAAGSCPANLGYSFGGTYLISETVCGTHCTVNGVDNPNDGWVISSRTSGTETKCPTGYTASGSSCVLTNPRTATPDKKCDMQFSGSGSGSKYLYYDDADCPNGPTIDNSKLVPGLRRDGKTAFVSGVDANGRPHLVEVAIQDDGTQITVRDYTQVGTETAPAVQTQTATVNPSTGQVTGYQSTTNPGTITQPEVVPTTSPTTGTPTDTPTANVDPTKEATITCGLPGTPACAVDDTNFKNKDPVADKVTTASAQLDAMKSSVENTGSNLPNIGRDWFPSLLPGSAVACHPIPVTITHSKGPLAGLGGSQNLDICPYMDAVRQILGYLIGVYTVWHIWRRFTNAKYDH